MFSNYLKISFRHLWNQPLYSTINILGLSIALAFLLLVSLFIKQEFSFDGFHEHSKRLYRLTTTITGNDGNIMTVGRSGQVQGPAFKEAVPEIEDYVRIFAVSFNVKSAEKALRLEGLFADKQFLRLFSFPLIAGDQQTAFKDPDAVLLTRRAAMKFFGSVDVLGSTLRIEHGSFSKLFRVTGIVKDLPAHSSIQFEILVPFSYLQESWKDEDWLSEYLSTFLLLNPNTNPATLSPRLNAVFIKQASAQLLKQSAGKEGPQNRTYGLQPISDLHLNRKGLTIEDPGRNSTGVSSGSITYSLILSGIAGFIILMAAVNFVNLAIAGSLKRTKEIAVRKINGSSRMGIVTQFLFESALLCITAFMLGLLLSYALLPSINVFLETELSFAAYIDLKLLLGWSALLIITVLLSGLYPAFLLSRFKPIPALFGQVKITSGHWLGKALVTFQFIVAICLLVATITFYNQMKFIRDKDLGYDPGHIIRFFIPLDKPAQDVPRLKQDIVAQHFVESIATGSDNTVAVLGGFPTIINGRQVSYVNTHIDTSFLATVNIRILQGRNFSTSYREDITAAAIVNQAFVKAAGLTNPVGSQFNNTWGAGELRTIIGVVQDYHFSSLKDRIYPQVLLMTDDLPFFWVKIKEGKEEIAARSIAALVRKYAPAYPFEFNFLEDEIKRLYVGERRWQSITSYATLLSVFICSIGLFGLSHLAAAGRSKEIGVRKVLGASVYSIISLLARDVVTVLLMAILIAFPVAWMLMRNWLQDFAYRIELNWLIFLTAALAGLIIPAITVCYHSIKAATANPVNSLRTE